VKLQHIGHINNECSRALGLGQERTGVRPCSRLLSYLTVMVIGVEWLREPDVPVTIKVTP
jgi:hypothetical protein